MVSQINQEKVHNLIRLIYEAAGEPQQWPAFLRAFGTAVRASAVGLVVIDSGTGKAGVDESVNVDPSYQTLFVQHYGSINPWTTPESAHLWTPGSVLEGRDIIADSEMLKTEFYNGLLRPQGWFSALGGAIHRNESFTGYITALRPRSVEPNEGRQLLNDFNASPPNGHAAASTNLPVRSDCFRFGRCYQSFTRWRDHCRY